MRSQLLYLAKTDLVKTYRGAALGWTWALIQPLIFMGVYWFVFNIGWRIHKGADGVDFFTWLVVGLVAWFFMQDMLSAGTNSFKSYKYLVTKMAFPISTIPTFVTMSKLLVHFGLLVLLLVYLIFKGDVSIYWLQLPFYTILMAGFFIVWSLFAAPLAAISKDFANAVKSLVRVLFWMSGILWSIDRLGIKWIHDVMLFNPITFFVDGYRQALIGHSWFFEEPKKLIVFACVFIAMTFIAYGTFKRARKEIVDVL